MSRALPAHDSAPRGGTRPGAAPRPRLFRTLVDPRAVLAYLGVMLVLSFVIEHPLLLAALAASAWMVLVGLVPAREYRPYLAYGSVAAVGVMLLNPLVSRAGESILWTGPTLPLIGQFTVSAEAVVYGAGMGMRLLAVVAVFALYSTIVDPDALYRMIAPMSPGSALVTALSIRLFPTTVADAGRIMDAQRSRGLRLDGGPWSARVRARGPVMDALLLTSLDRSMRLAEALESRGYGRPGRTRLPDPGFARRDFLVLGLAAACGLLGAWLAFAAAPYAYYPVMGDPARPAHVAWAVVLAVLTAFPLLLDRGWTPSRSSTSAI